MRLLLVLCVLAVGAILPVQAGVNAELRRHLGHPFLAAAVNMVVGAAAVVAAVIVLRVPMPSRAAVASAPWWAFAGGLIGVTMVTVSLMAAPRLGAALLIALLVVAQLLAGTIIDHFGLVGYPKHPVSAMRIAGVALLVAGVLLVERG